MIHIEDKSKCCGCSACVSGCPVGCIDFNEDEHGFQYPIVDLSRCINCGLCERVCPCLNDSGEKTPEGVYAAINPNEEFRQKSSSGAFFTAIAEYVLNNGGIVFGACFDSDWVVVHDCIDKIEDIERLRRSKYSQSQIGDSFKKALEFLKSGKLVLFTGTTCQIDGLNRFLRKEYANLITVDTVCHGVPSPMIWKDYLHKTLEDKQRKMDDITYISFRDKTTGWKNYSMVIKADDEVLVDEQVGKNVYLQGFINNLYLRPSCFSCPSKSGRCKSDFSLADFWAIKSFLPEIDDNKGVTLLYVNSQKGEGILRNLHLNLTELDKTQELNSAYSHSARVKYPVDVFWNLYSRKGLEAITEICEKMKPNGVRIFLNRAVGFIKRKLK